MRALPQYLALLALCFGCLGATAGAVPLEAENARKILVEYITNTNSYESLFDQVLTDEEGGLIEAGSGRFWLARPGRFRWLYETPWPRQIIADGTSIWLYDEELEQVTVRDLGEILAQTPAGILAGDIAALDNYAISGETTPTGAIVSLQPSTMTGDFEMITMRFADDELRELVLKDRFGQQTAIRFTDIMQNQALDPGVFEFAVPPGADVIDETGGS